jgi:hypothetical protein
MTQAKLLTPGLIILVVEEVATVTDNYQLILWASGLQTFFIMHPYISNNNHYAPPLLANMFIYKLISYIYT